MTQAVAFDSAGAAGTAGTTGVELGRAVHRHGSNTRQGLLERAFTLAFRGLVYAQIWEDPVIDMEALQLGPGMHLVTIASGGCNALSYLTADPARITAVDLNPAHVALGRLKIAAVRHLDQPGFRRFFGDAASPANIAAYHQQLAPHLDAASRDYWEGRNLRGSRRIDGFAHNFYRRGLLGGFITIAQRLARLYGIRPERILAAASPAEQRAIFDTHFAPLFEKRFVRWLTSNPASLFGLGIPPEQYKALLGDADTKGGMAGVLRRRLEKLACDFDVHDNYFAWQAFGRGYSPAPGASLPPYLAPENHAAVVDRIDRLEFTRINYIDYLRSRPAASLDRYVLLDAQDWMSDALLTALWAEITRTARAGARVVFRTAAEPTLLPGRVPPDILDRWTYHAAASLDFTRRDRSSIYGGVHLYTLAGA